MRRLVLDSGVWRYRVGEYYDENLWTTGPTLELVTPAGRRVDVPRVDVEAMSVPVSGTWQRAVTPGAIRRYIEERIDEL